MIYLRSTPQLTRQVLYAHITAAWPDLQAGRPNWVLRPTHPARLDALHVPTRATSRLLVIRNTEDLQDSQTPNPEVVLVCIRTITLLNGLLATSAFRAHIVERSNTVHSFLQHFDLGIACEGSPCLLVQNQRALLQPKAEQWRSLTGDVYQIYLYTHIEFLHDYVPHPTQWMERDPLFWDLHLLPPTLAQIAVVIRPDDQVTSDDLTGAVQHMQAMLATWTADVYDSTNMAALREDLLFAFFPEEDVVHMRLLTPAVPLHVANRFYEIETLFHIDGDEDWTLVELQRPSSDALLPDATYFGVKPLRLHHGLSARALTLGEICFAPFPLQMPPAITHRSRYLPLFTTFEGLIQEYDLELLCQWYDCVVRVNNRFLLPGTWVLLADGTFLQFLVGPDGEELPTSPSASPPPPKRQRAVAADDRTTVSRGHSQTMPFSSQSSHAASSSSTGHPQTTHRFGEASHPGPPFWLGTSNPSGLRHKECHYFDLPPGLWGVAETHLTISSQCSASQTLKTIGHQRQRALQILHGAPVAPRARSLDTGTWSGVSMIADAQLQNINIQWPNSEYVLGRAQITRAWVGPWSVLGANIYAWPRSPTWPQAVPALHCLLDHLTKEIVLSRSGPRYILGDFNTQDLDTLPAIALWKELGWVEVQEWAWRFHQRQPTPTSRGQSTVDYLFVTQ